MEGSARQWERGCRWPGEGQLCVVGKALQAQGPRPTGLSGHRNSLACCLHLQRKSTCGAPGAGSSAASNQSAGAAPTRTAEPAGTPGPSRTELTELTERPGAPSTPAVALKGPEESGVPLKSSSAGTRRRGDPRAEPRAQKSHGRSSRCSIQRELQVSENTSWASVALSDLREEGPDPGRRFTAPSSITFTPYLSLISNFLKPEEPTKAAMRLMEKTVEVMKLDKQVKEAQAQQRTVLEETRQLLREKFHVEADTKFMLDHLTNKTEEYRREMSKLWDKYAQESGEIQQRREESASKYAKQTSELQKQLLEKEKKEFDLKRQLRAVRDISLVKEKQDREIQMLQEELKKPRGELKAKAYADYVQEKALLEKQLSQPDGGLLGKTKRKGPKSKAQALQAVAERLAVECCHDLHTENQRLLDGLMQQARQCREAQATRRRLQNRKRQLQLEQWYTECLIRGRQRLRQGAPKAAGTPPPGTK
ncbi:coiled-coil domain-containing protein 121 [Artibeus jamaicensis]|uniref:coiled-coil domain-containing protein 121 n=1 Tax=Artibeus jamaicensis TaxID=9417 RepID=UPI00235A6326|nr:coiled-coil domain-containing protein 121 [Artibeus jamaicensis]